jgi:hypothetical protein
MTRQPSDRAHRLVERRALRWVRHTWPDLWNHWLDEAYDEIGATRRAPPRRPTVMGPTVDELAALRSLAEDELGAAAAAGDDS